jgi:hypothetical protein
MLRAEFTVKGVQELRRLIVRDVESRKDKYEIFRYAKLMNA